MISRKDILNTMTNVFLSQGATNPSSLTDLSNIKQEIKTGYEPEGRKEEPKETGTGSSGTFVGPLSGEMKEKWSEKYKKSINCNNPKGFSQRAHCQGRKKKLREEINESVRTHAAQLKDIARKYAKEVEGRTEKDKIEKMISVLKKELRKGIDAETQEHKMSINKIVQIVIDHLNENPYYYSESEKPKKTETKEATGASSAGQYSGPAFGAKSMSPKDWRGRAKTQIPGGAFVQVKKKCKTFPYCNQGDINALNISRNPIVKKKKKKLSEQYGVSEELIMKIIINELNKNIKK